MTPASRALLQAIPLPEGEVLPIGRFDLLAVTSRRLLFVALGMGLLAALLPARLRLDRPASALLQLALVGGAVLLIWAWLRRSRREVEEMNAATEHGVRGDSAAMAEAFRLQARGTGARPQLRAWALANLGMSEAHLGHTEVARRLLAQALRSGHLSGGAMAQAEAWFLPNLPLTEALLGKLPEARAWFEAEKPADPAKPEATALLLARIVVALRSGEREAAHALLLRWGLELESAAIAGHRRGAALLLAFCSPDETARDDALARLFPLHPGQLTSFWAHWPELEAFAQAHGLTGS